MSEKFEFAVLGGWGISPKDLEKFFPSGTKIFPPTRENALKAASAKKIFGYSLGAFLLLEAAEKNEIRHGNVELFAPFLTFPREKNRGGKISETQIKFLRRWLLRDFSSAIGDFYERANLSFPRPKNFPPYEISELEEGLEILLRGEILCVPETAKSWKFFLGENDALLDFDGVAAAFPKDSLRKISAGTHDLLTLVSRI